MIIWCQTHIVNYDGIATTATVRCCNNMTVSSDSIMSMLSQLEKKTVREYECHSYEN